ncbi:MAG: PhnD/SsuA/transferrin family substrate-binding protein [Nibricoccus sp.]
MSTGHYRLLSPYTPLRRSLATLNLLFSALAGAVSFGQNPAHPPKPNEVLRLGFSSNVFSGLNESDARASVKALASTIAREHGIDADPDPLVTANLEESLQAVNDGLVDAIALPLDEYDILRKKSEFDRLLVATYGGDYRETYLLLVHKESSISHLADLKGKRMNCLTGARMTLARPWIDVELAKASLPTLDRFVSTVSEIPKAAKAVLPVFFHQSDACLVTERAYRIVVELNPQIGRDLRILARSQPYLPSIFAFRSGCPSSLKDKSIKVFCRLHQTPYGQQTLLIFQSPQVEERPAADLTISLKLLEEYSERCPAEYAARVAALNRNAENAARLKR